MVLEAPEPWEGWCRGSETEWQVSQAREGCQEQGPQPRQLPKPPPKPPSLG